MIDVVFQLLIYFLCTASFQVAEQSLPTTLPSSGAVAYQPSREVQELELLRITLSQPDRALRIELNGNLCADLSVLRERLKGLMALAPLPAVLDVAPDVELGHVISVYDSCLVTGVREIHFAAPEQ
jgi:biopolymer transport protein ExbD